jgi:hypothetical protein
MANTVIQLKYSEITATPTLLNVAEPAYSNSSGKLFIGDNNSTPVLIGGKYYVDRVDEATSANTANVIVKRDSAGSFSASVVRAALYGNANTATTLLNGRNFGLTGPDITSGNIGFDGSAAVTLQANLSTTGVAAGTYGGTSQIPTFAVDSRGRITSAANVSIATTLNIAADTGTNAVALATDTLTFVGGDGITSSITPTDNVRFDVDNTVIRTTGSQTISGNLAITGNLTILGNTITANVSSLVINDPLIQLAANNETSDAVDIGFYGHYSDDGGTSLRHAGLFRDVSTADKRFILFTNLIDQGLDNSAAVTVNTAQSSFAVANLQANLIGGRVTGLSQAIAIADGGTNATSFTTGQRILFDGTRLASQANVTTTVTGGLSVANTITSLTTNAYGDITAYTGAAIAIDTSQITSGNLAIARGGSNNNGGYTTGAILQYDGSKFVSLANTGTAATYANASHVPVITTDAYGRVSTVTNTAIAIAASQITSGTLGIARGGTGASSFTTKGVIVSDAASTTGALSALTSSTEGHVLQINASGVPTFAHLNGGYF